MAHLDGRRWKGDPELIERLRSAVADRSDSFLIELLLEIDAIVRHDGSPCATLAAMPRGTRCWLFHVVLPLAAGTATYLDRRAIPSSTGFGAWVRGNSADGLWCFALTMALALVWRGGASRPRRFWLAASLPLALGYELAQSVEWAPGLYDTKDLLTTFVFWTAACVLAGRVAKEER